MKIKPINGFEDGILSMEQALNLFYDLADLKGIPYHATEGGCLGRAYFMAKLAHNAGARPKHITSFAKGGGDLLMVADDERMKSFGGWYYHIAVVMPVHIEGGTIMDLVFDPSMFSGPVSVKQWSKAMGADLSNVFITDYREQIPIPNPHEAHWEGHTQIQTDHERSSWYDIERYRAKEKAIEGKREVSLSNICKQYFKNNRNIRLKEGKTWRPRGGKATSRSKLKK